MTTIDWPLRRSPRRRGRLLGFVLLAAFLLSAGTTLSYYVESLWFDSLGFSDVFWTALNLRAVVFVAFTALTFGIVYGSFLALNRWAAGISPFTHVPKLPGGAFTATPLVWLACVAAALTAAGLVALRRRDLA